MKYKLQKLPIHPAHKFNKGDLAITQVPLNSAFPRHYIPLGSRVTIVDVYPANGHVTYLVLDDADADCGSPSVADRFALVDETALEMLVASDQMNA